MANTYIVCMVLQRAVYSIILTFCILYRPLGLTLPYLLLLLYLPFVPVATVKTIRRHTGYYFQISIALIVLVFLVQISVQIVLATLGEQIVSSCNFLEIHLGIIKFNGMPVISILEWFLPDIIMVLSTPSIYLILRYLTVTMPHDSESSQSIVRSKSNQMPAESSNVLTKLGVFLSMAALLITSTLQPSIPGAIYFITFLGAATCWACNKDLDRKFAIIGRVVMMFLTLHIIALLAYQTPWKGEYFTDDSTLIRFLGFSSLYAFPNCTFTEGDVREFYFDKNAKLEAFLNPVAIIFCFITLTISTGISLNKKTNLNEPPGTSRLSNNEVNNPTNNMDIKSPRRQWHATAGKVMIMRSMKNSMNLMALKKTGVEVSVDKEIPPTICEQIFFGLMHVGDLLFKNSYILSNIIMMVWSIVYHSWVTFIFLLWANFLFIFPNQRKNTLRCSPFVVIYAEILLLAQYLYGMRLSESELPSKYEINGINLSQIGFIRYDIPCLHLLLKTLFTLTFWVTLKRKTFEYNVKKQSSTEANFADTSKTDKKSKFIVKAGNVLNAIFLRLWIWIVLFVLFSCAIYGEKITTFRIVYMTLVLIFLITFQLSFRVWRKILYSFWMVVIGFSMLSLIMTYSYQFDGFSDYWFKYFKIPYGLQSDIGLRKFETKDLFLNLLYPTLVVIITVVQLQIVHKNYLKTLHSPPGVRKNGNTDDQRSNAESSVNYGELEADTSTEDTISTKKHNIKLKDLRSVTLKQVAGCLIFLYKRAKELLEFISLVLEIHATNIILIVAFSLGIVEVSVLHILPILMALIAVTSPKYLQLVLTRSISFVVGVLVILKMIYQIEYIEQNKYNVNCINDNTSISNTTISNTTINNATVNDANWFGFSKITGTDTLATILKGYISYILITTIHTIILLREKRKRLLNGKPMTTPKLLFPKVTRKDADKDLVSMLKYLANFVVYKFGIEITLIMLVVLIGTLMDIIALIYSVWLCVLFAVTRETQKRIWPFFQWFIFALILIQYIVFIGIPPHFCVVLPWNTDILEHFQEWAMLPHHELRRQSNKLIFDFLLLICAYRQMLVFRTESRYQQLQIEFHIEFPGGSNKSVVDDINSATTIPSHDFVTYTRNWLDVLKCAVFLGFFWMTLVVVFLAGTNRINIFSLGYLIGSFIFLWQGADFYLRPIHTIIRYWRLLIAYNIFVITTKALLQIQACIFTMEKANLRWLNQLFGMSCIRKYIHVSSNSKVPNEEVGLVWDGICFTFLLLQLRIFQSCYFYHVINETKASTILASRGAELIEILRQEQVKLQMKLEEEILLKIKQKMDRIKANQQKLQPSFVVEEHNMEDVSLPAHSTRVSSRAGNHRKIATYQPSTDFSRSISALNVHASPGLTVSSNAYLDHQYLSYESPTGSEYAMRRGVSTEDSYPVSPLPIDVEQWIPAQGVIVDQTIQPVYAHTLQPVLRRSNRRQSSINTVSWTDQVDSSFGPSRPLSINIDPLNVHQPSVEFSFRKYDDYCGRDNEEMSRSTQARRRPCSWEPDSICLSETDRSMLSHQESIRSGDYHLFDDMNEKLNLNLLYEKATVVVEDDILKRSISPKITLKEVIRSLDCPKEELLQFYGQKNGKDGDSIKILRDSDEDLSEPTASDEKVRSFLTIFKTFIPDLVVSITLRLYNMSRNYRYVTKVLSKEKRDLKAQNDFGKEFKFTARNGAPSVPSLLESTSMKDTPEAYENFNVQKHSLLTDFIISLWYAFISNTDLMCYLLVFINMIAAASIMSMFLPFMVFLWGTLTIPRPSRTFWITLISYTQVVVLVKCLCQFDLWWNSQTIPPNDPLAPARIIGLEKKPNSTTYDLTLLIMLFFHRFMLKQMGIWQFTSDESVNNINITMEKEEDVQGNPTQQVRISLILPSSEQEESNVGDGKLVNEDGETNNHKYLPKLAIRLSEKVKKSCSSCTNFFHKLLVQTNRVQNDVYVHIFLCDFTNFFVLFFGFTAFGSSQGDEGVVSYVEENKIPVAFLIMLLLQFVFIIVDRALYLRKNLIGKIVFQFISVIGMHVWLFFLVPALSERNFNAKAAPVAYYFFKCCYFLLSAYQIRCGFPKRILGNCLTKRFSLFNLCAFKVYMITPFLFELRALMDWIWTDTTMPLFEWLKMEDIFANIFEIKCSREMEKDLPVTRGVAKRSLMKHIMGGGFLLAVIALIWGPLALFALGNTVGEANVPLEVSLELKIGPYEPIYRMNSQSSKIHQFKPVDFDELSKVFENDKIALTFLSNYDSVDIAAIDLGTNSTAIWIISPPDLERLIDDLLNNVTLKVQNKYSLSRKTHNEKMLGTISMEPDYIIKEDDNVIREAMIRMLTTNNSSERLTLPFLFPKFLKVINIGSELKTIPQLTDGKALRDISLRMHTSQNRSYLNTWWEVLENCTDDLYSNIYKSLPYSDCYHNLVLYTFSDKLFPETLSLVTAGGVIGIYTTFVFIASSIFRSMFAGGSAKIMFSELPYVDRILQLCLDIYLVRESMEFALEEDLFAKLIFLYRSPETMIKWTRSVIEQSNDDDTDNIQNKDEALKNVSSKNY